MKHILTTLIVLASISAPTAVAKEYSLESPDGKLKISVETGKTTTWSMAIGGETVSAKNRISLTLKGGKVLGDNSSVTSVAKATKNEHIVAPFYRKAQFDVCYNSLILKMKGGYSIEMRAYDEGVAYRIITNMKDSLTVMDEDFEFRCNDKIVMADKPDFKTQYESSFEFQYTTYDKPTLSPEGTHSYLPILIDRGEKGKILLMQTDMLDYPGPFMTSDTEGLKSYFPKATKDFNLSKRYNKHRFETFDHIARIPGKSSLPWRIAAFAQEDRDLPTNNMSYALASACRIEDTSWIVPGQSTWDWWNGFMLTGVDFRSGINTDTYKYHIDFAAANGIPYVILDEGWYAFPGPATSAEALSRPWSERPSLMDPISDVKLEELCNYSKAKGVKLILWATAHLIDYIGADRVFERFSDMGVAGFKLDFIDGQDQESVKMLTDIAASAAKYHLIVDYHGVYAPAGLTRTYPNVVNFEGVWGLEMIGNERSVMPQNDVNIPFIRMVAGQMDYTPGAMDCCAKNEKQTIRRGCFVQGTRAHQVAQYVVYDAPLSMLCDSPSKYLREFATLSFITSIPTTFDDTFVQNGKVGEYIVTVRKKGGDWYVGGLTNWDARDYKLDFGFLPEGKYKATIYRDGANSDRVGNDYIIKEVEVCKGQTLDIHMAPGGGFAAVIKAE